MNVPESTDIPVVMRLARRISNAMTRLGIRVKRNQPDLTARQKHEALVNSASRRTPEQRRDIMDRAAKHPRTEEVLARGDAAFARYLEQLESGDVPDNF